MAKLKLTYFDFSGSRGEECRLALSIAGVDFEDERLSRKQWLERKANTPFGSVPVLQEEGKPALGQTNAILALIGRRHGLLPLDDDWEMARLEALLAAGDDFRAAVSKTFRIEDPAESKAAREKLVAGPLTSFAQSAEAQIKGPFAGGEKLSVADIKLHVIVAWIKKGVLQHVPTDAFDSFPKLSAVYEGVLAHPQVKAWYEKYPPSA